MAVRNQKFQKPIKLALISINEFRQTSVSFLFQVHNTKGVIKFSSH